mgnify:FL=1
MIRLMCSDDRKGLEALESRLYQAGIRSEIRGNPLTAALGISRFEIHVEEADWQAASEVCQELAMGERVEAPPNFQAGRDRRGFARTAPAEVIIDAETVSPAAPDLGTDHSAVSRPETETAEIPDDLAEATALLRDEVEALLAREAKLVEYCASLEEKVKTLEESLSRARADLTRELSHRSSTEKKLVEVTAARDALEQDRQAFEVRLKASEQALAAAQARIESQIRQQEQLLKQRKVEHSQIQAYAGTVQELRSRLKGRLAAKKKPGATAAEESRTRPRASGR